MPRGDGTGPAGMGPMTGRGAGYCAGYPAPGYMNPLPGRGLGLGFRGGWGRGAGFGRGLGLGFRGGRGWGAGYGGAYPAYAPPNTYSQPPTPAQEADMLKGQAEYFAGMLDDIKKRISELEAAGQDKE